MTKLSLYAWANKYDVTYSTAQKMIQRDEIIVERVGKKIMVDENQQPPKTDKIVCVLCGSPMNQITASHLKYHDYTLQRYKTEFPEALIVGSDVSARISNAITGTVRSEETKMKVSLGRTGIIPKNHPRFVKGVYTFSNEAKRKMSKSHEGIMHTEESKKKIGDGNRGKIITQEAIEKARATWVLKMENGFVGPFTGMKHTIETRKNISEKTTIRFANMSPEQRKILNEKISLGGKGVKRTDEQKSRYRAATLKRMRENPESFRMMKDTKLEKNFEAWCQENLIAYTKQLFLTFEGETHPYDFYLPDFNMVVECDGPHHWSHIWFPVKDKTKEQAFLDQQAKDNFWTIAALELGYNIVRLRGVTEVGDEGSGSIEEQMEEWLSIEKK